MQRNLNISNRIIAVGFVATVSGIAFERGHTGLAVMGLSLLFAATIERTGNIIASAVRGGCAAIAKAILKGSKSN